MVAEKGSLAAGAFDCSRTCQHQAPSGTGLPSRPLRSTLRPPALCGFATSLAHCECVWSKMCFDSGCPLPEASNRALGEPRNWDLNREPFRPSSAQRSGLALRLLQRPRAPTRHCSCFRSSASMRAWSVPGWRSDSVAAVNSSFGIRLPRSKIVARSAR